MKKFEELDSPVPKHIEQILAYNLRILDALSLKYRLSAEKITPEQWKQEITDRFKDDSTGKILSLIEALRINNKLEDNLFEK